MLRVCSGVAGVSVLTMAALTIGCGSSSPPISVILSPSSPQATDQGQTVGISANIKNDASAKGVLWSLTGPGTLGNSTGLSVTYSSPTANVTSAQQATVTATSVADQSKSASVQITVNPPPQIPSQTLAGGSVGTPYSQTIGLTGGTPPFEWSVYNGPILTGTSVGGSVPDGLTLDATTGKLSGTPTAGGTWYFEASVTDAAGVTVDNGFLSVQIDSSAPGGNPVPFLNQPVVPAAVSPGSSSFTLHISGTGFVSGATIDFDGVPLPTIFIDSGHLAALVPATNVANPHTASITAVNPSPGGGRSTPAYFEVGAATTAVNFVNAPTSPLQIYFPLGVAAADFNEDGKADLVVAANIRAYTFLGNGDGTFSPATGSPMGVPSPPYDDFASPYTGPIAVGDFNNSGHLGLALAETNNLAAVVLLGKGDGSFVPSSAGFAGALAMPLSAIIAADFNGDGNLDLAIGSQLYGQLPLALGYGKGAFNAAGNQNTGLSVSGLAAGDFNGDGKLDTVSAGSPGMMVSLGNGDGTFTLASGSPFSLGQTPSAVVAGDFNGDGKLDIAVADSAANDVFILLGNGDGTLGAATTIAVGNQPDAMVAGDFNNDGKLDLAVANYADGTITLLLGNGDGTFTPSPGSPYAAGAGSYAIAAADFNGDGKLDLAVANLTAGTVSILLQQ